MKEQRLLRDGERLRIPLRTRQNDAGPMRLTTDTGQSGLALNKPGFRCLLEDGAGTAVKERAYEEYEKQLVDAYKSPRHDDDGDQDRDNDNDNGDESDHPSVRATSDTIAQMVRDHQNKMERRYDEFDRELTEAWRRS